MGAKYTRCNSRKSVTSRILFSMDREVSVVLDIQCYKDNNNSFIIKEIAAIDVETGSLLLHHIVCPPYDRKLLTAEKLRESYWLEKYYHGLEWGQGDIVYQVLLNKVKLLFTSVSHVFVKGEEKASFIKSILPRQCTVIDLECLHCQSLDVLNSLFTKDTLRCSNHKAVDHKCALSNSLNLRKWYLITQK
jgi:hypothetical protein